MSSFSERLKELRKAKGETQVSMARMLRCTEQHYQRIEYGKVTPNAIMLITLADFFNVSTDYLLGRTNFSIDADGNITIKMPPDLFNLNTEKLKKETGNE